MTDAAHPPQGKDEFEKPINLHLDLMNPRAPDEDFGDENAVLEYLLDHADVNELVQSILSSGWLDYEPLIVLEEGNIVLEGNRRLAALRIISDEALRERLKIELPSSPSPAAIPAYVRIRRVKSRNEARDFIGFKHINGPFKWDALAKAKYAAEWFRDGGDINQPPMQPRSQRVCPGGGTNESAERADHREDAGNIALIEDVDGNARAHEVACDVGLQVGEGEHQVRLECQDFGDVSRDERRYPRLLAPHPWRPNGIA